MERVVEKEEEQEKAIGNQGEISFNKNAIGSFKTCSTNHYSKTSIFFFHLIQQKIVLGCVDQISRIISL
jgi:hypothetical protein